MTNQKSRLLLVVLSVFSLIVILPTIASATTVSFVSGDGLNEGNNLTGSNVPITPHPAWDVAPWTSYANTGYGGISPSNTTVGGTPTAVFWEEFFLPGTVNSGSLTAWADDTMSIFLFNSDYLTGIPLFAANPIQDNACADGPIACQLGESLTLQMLGLPQGLNRLEFSTFQIGGGPFGYAVQGSVDSVPEPATIALVGFGLLGLAFVRRRRRKTA